MAERYSADVENWGDVEVVTLREGDDFRARVAPTLGNNCFAFEGAAPILEPLPFERVRENPGGCGIPILFPFPNRVRDGVFHFRGRAFPVEPARHGFVRDKVWERIDLGANAEAGAWVTSRLDAADYPDTILAQFPFPFQLEVTYRLRDGVLSMETEARNTGTGDMPLGFGIHPYFRLPERYAVRLPAAKRWELEAFLPTGRLLEVEGTSYDFRQLAEPGDLRLDDLYTEILPDPDGLARCLLEDRDTGLQTVVQFDPECFPNLIGYVTPEPRQALCIEPQTCPTDAFNLEVRGIPANVLVLAPGESVSFQIDFYTQRA